MKFKKIDLKNISKSTMFMIVGGIFLFIGMMLYMTRPQVQYDSNTQIMTTILSVDESKTLMDSLIKNIINLYEKPAELFDVTPEKYEKPEEKKEEEKKEEKKETSKKSSKKKTTKKEETPVVVEEPATNALAVNNYNEIVTKLFTEKGIKQLEDMKFNDVNYIVKDGEKVYFLNDVIGKDNKFSADVYVYGKPVITENKIRCRISFNRATIDTNDDTNYELFIKELVIVKKDDNWLIDSFDYSNG